MSALDVNTLLEEVKCYACFDPESVPEIAKLALLSRISQLSGGEELKQASQIIGTAGLAPLNDGLRPIISNNFTPSSNYSLTQMRMWGGRFPASVGIVTLNILARAGTQAAGTPTGPILASSINTLDISTLTDVGYPNAAQPITFLFAPAYPLVNGGGYCHVWTINVPTIAWSALSSSLAGIGVVSSSAAIGGPWVTFSANRQIQFQHWGV